MARTIIRSYGNYEQAAAVVGMLQEAGLAPDRISLLGRPIDAADSGAEEGLQAGSVVGGGAGLLGALVSLPVPGVGPVLAAGWLVAGTALGAVAGAAAGSLVSALADAGVEEREAHVLAEVVKRGGAIVAVRAPDDQIAIAQAAMTGGRPIDPKRMRETYEREGWAGFELPAKQARKREDLSGVVS